MTELSPTARSYAHEKFRGSVGCNSLRANCGPGPTIMALITSGCVFTSGRLLRVRRSQPAAAAGDATAYSCNPCGHSERLLQL